MIAIKAPIATDRFANVPFTAKQYQAILDEAAWYVDDRVSNREREIYSERMCAFLELLRHTGMDLGDAVGFQPSIQLADEQVDGESIPVLRYRRAKTGIEAIIPLARKLAQVLRAIPLAPTSMPLPSCLDVCLRGGTSIEQECLLMYRRNEGACAQFL